MSRIPIFGLISNKQERLAARRHRYAREARNQLIFLITDLKSNTCMDFAGSPRCQNGFGADRQPHCVCG